jgi:hypothetical protein
MATPVPWTFFVWADLRNPDEFEGVSMKKLTLSKKITRLRSRLHEKEWRRYGALLLIGKGAGIAIILTLAMFTNLDYWDWYRTHRMRPPL